MLYANIIHNTNTNTFRDYLSNISIETLGLRADKGQILTLNQF